MGKKQQGWRDAGLNAEEIAFESKNWQLLDALRIVKKIALILRLKPSEYTPIKKLSKKHVIF